MSSCLLFKEKHVFLSSCQKNMPSCLLVKEKHVFLSIRRFLSAPSPFLHVRPQLRILRLNVYRYSEDASCINQTFGENAEHAFVNLTHGRREEADDGKRETSYQHPYG